MGDSYMQPLYLKGTRTHFVGVAHVVFYLYEVPILSEKLPLSSCQVSLVVHVPNHKILIISTPKGYFDHPCHSYMGCLPPPHFRCTSSLVSVYDRGGTSQSYLSYKQYGYHLEYFKFENVHICICYS